MYYRVSKFEIINDEWKEVAMHNFKDEDILQSRRNALRSFDVFQEVAEQADEPVCFRVYLMDLDNDKIAKIAGEDYCSALSGLIAEAHFFEFVLSLTEVSKAPLYKLFNDNIKEATAYIEYLDDLGEVSFPPIIQEDADITIEKALQRTFHNLKHRYGICFREN